jgi:hypothetical protein
MDGSSRKVESFKRPETIEVSERNLFFDKAIYNILILK